MILKALIVLEIAATSVIISWFFLANNPIEPPQSTPVTSIVLEVPTTTPEFTPKTTQGATPIVIPTQTPPQPQIPTTPTESTQPTPIPPPPTPQIIYVPIYITQPAPDPLPNEPQPIMTTTIEIVSPTPGKGLGRTYTAQPQIIDETNYIELGLIVRENGEPTGNAVVTITATDESQNKILNGTGITYPRYENGVRLVTLFYQFHYEFKTVGDHTITFSVPGADLQSVTLTVTEPDPA